MFVSGKPTGSSPEILSHRDLRHNVLLSLSSFFLKSGIFHFFLFIPLHKPQSTLFLSRDSALQWQVKKKKKAWYNVTHLHTSLLCQFSLSFIGPSFPPTVIHPRLLAICTVSSFSWLPSPPPVSYSDSSPSFAFGSGNCWWINNVMEVMTGLLSLRRHIGVQELLITSVSDSSAAGGRQGKNVWHEFLCCSLLVGPRPDRRMQCLAVILRDTPNSRVIFRYKLEASGPSAHSYSGSILKEIRPPGHS